MIHVALLTVWQPFKRLIIRRLQSTSPIDKVYLSMRISASTNFKEGCMLSTEKPHGTLSIKQSSPTTSKNNSYEMHSSSVSLVRLLLGHLLVVSSSSSLSRSLNLNTFDKNLGAVLARATNNLGECLC
jgi:hypothetical protein